MTSKFCCSPSPRSRRTGRALPDDPSAPNLDGAELAADALRERAAAERPAWWDAERGGVNLAGLDLRGIGLREADLSGASLGGSGLSGAKGPGVRLPRSASGAGALHGADLAGADLSGAKAGEASFDQAMLEDASLANAGLRYASLREAILDGANMDGADLWARGSTGQRRQRQYARRAARRGEPGRRGSVRRGPRGRVAEAGGPARREADGGEPARRAARRRAARRGRLVQRPAAARGADRLRASPCPAGRRLARTHADAGRPARRRYRRGGAGEFDAARDGYSVLEQNFDSLGDADAASWAFRQRRRMGKRESLRRARACWREGKLRPALVNAASWLSDAFAEWLCDYGESLPRVARAFAAVLVFYALLYGVTGSLVRKRDTRSASCPTSSSCCSTASAA